VSAENIINNPPKEFTGPCEACGVSEFQLGVRNAEERIIKVLMDYECKCLNDRSCNCLCQGNLIELIKGETK